MGFVNRSASIQENEASPPRHRSSARGEGGSGRSKPRASYACVNCRQRKIKCTIDPVRKRCSSCRSLQIPCVISRDGDRRKLASREQISLLQDRLRHLENVVATHGNGSVQSGSEPKTAAQELDSARQELDAPGNEPNDAGNEVHATENGLTTPINDLDAPGLELDTPSQALNASTSSKQRPRRVTEPVLANFALRSPRAIDDSNSNHQDGANFNFDNNYIAGSSALDGRYSFSSDIAARTNGGVNMDAVFDTPFKQSSNNPVIVTMETSSAQVFHAPAQSAPESPRLDVDEESSQPRFYGPTSQRHTHGRSVPRDLDLLKASTDGDTELNVDSGPVRRLLQQTFFKTQPLSQAIIDEITFETGKTSTTRSEYYSTFLENGILACATRMSTSPAIRALGPTYADRAASQITHELQWPNVATLQGFLILSDFEATRGRDRLGYIYSGIGCRMVFDLGLQESCSELIVRGKLSPAEALSRHILFLGAYVYDKLWGLYLGRPYAIPNSHLISAQRRIAEQKWELPPTLEAWVGLASEISEVTEILNSSDPFDWRSLDCLVELDHRISQRCAALPDWLKLDESKISDLPAVAYGLQIQFRGIRIVLHRLLSKAIAHNSAHMTSPQNDRIQQSRSIMQESAHCIARLASVYEQIFGIENVITVMLDNMYVAAAVLIADILRHLQQDGSLPTDPFSERDIRWLRCLAEMLQKAQQHYPVSARMRYTLGCQVDGTPLKGFFGSWPRPSRKQDLLQNTVSQFDGLFDDNSTGQTFDGQQNLFTQGPLSVSEAQLFQGMDMTNMMSWMLSPTD